MILLVTSFLAGMLSILAPCAIALIPILIARSATGERQRSPFFVIAGLSVSIIVFSILLKSTTLLIGVPSIFWGIVSGLIVTLFGVVTLFPSLWEKMALALGLPLIAQRNLAAASSKRGVWADVLLGASLGPVFSACSPTYALIVASILPADPLVGLSYLVAYVAGLALLLSLIAVFGRVIVDKLKWGINPKSIFHKILGSVLIIIGVMIMTGLDKQVLSLLVGGGLFDWQINFESGLTVDAKS